MRLQERERMPSAIVKIVPMIYNNFGQHGKCVLVTPGRSHNVVFILFVNAIGFYELNLFMQIYFVNGIEF